MLLRKTYKIFNICSCRLNKMWTSQIYSKVTRFYFCNNGIILNSNAIENQFNSLMWNVRSKVLRVSEWTTHYYLGHLANLRKKCPFWTLGKYYQNHVCVYNNMQCWSLLIAHSTCASYIPIKCKVQLLKAKDKSEHKIQIYLLKTQGEKWGH